MEKGSDLLPGSGRDETETVRERQLRLLPYVTFALYLMLAFVFGSFLVFLYWRFFDPVAPNISVVSTEVVDHGHGQFEVRRLVESDRTMSGTLHAEFERKPPTPPIRRPDGTEVVPDRSKYEIASVGVLIEQGRHQRDRFWQIPLALLPGDYVYRSRVEFCNSFRLRCVTVEFPPIDAPRTMGRPEAGPR